MAPRLRKLCIHSGCLIPMPWPQLTDITLTSCPSPDIFLDILAQCTNLVKASIITGSSLLSGRTDIIALDHLRTLHLTFAGIVVHSLPFLDCISAPALDDLGLPVLASRLEWAEATFTAFQLRSPNITRLEIQGVIATVPSRPNLLIAALLHAPSLTHLAIGDCWDLIDDAFLRALCYTDGAPLVPHLHSLVLTELFGCFSEDVLTSMVTSRWWTDTELASRSSLPTVARWKCIHLGAGSTYKPSQKIRNRMNDLRQAGLDIELQGHDKSASAH
ncbi:hypothetical protein K438DRAFT_933107 [Mycena galopus ATCC 62051]|nr:hypothetical protein K438DRAFT_933107 [Mycena galopus ATCC 62051]